MNCKRVKIYFYDFMDGLLTKELNQSVSDHLINCSKCAEELEEAAAVISRVRILPREINPSNDLWENIAERISRSEKENIQSNTIPRKSYDSKKYYPGRKIIAVSAAAAAVLIITLLLVFINKEQTPFWQVEQLAGFPLVGNQKITMPGKLEVGDWIITDDSSKARLKVGIIGEVDVHPHSRVRLLSAKSSEHRISLERGKIEAAIWAPPKLFFVETPSATAIDLGCMYELNIAEDGSGYLHVTSGWVAFEHNGRESMVPKGALCETRISHGPGTPYYQTASEYFKSALMQIDFENGGDDMLNIVLDEANRSDALSLWHLLKNSNERSKIKIYNRLKGMYDISDKIVFDDILAGNKEMFLTLWEELELGSKSIWKF